MIQDQPRWQRSWGVIVLLWCWRFVPHLNTSRVPVCQGLGWWLNLPPCRWSPLTKHQFWAVTSHSLKRLDLHGVKFCTHSFQIGPVSMAEAMGAIELLGHWHSASHHSYICPFYKFWVVVHVFFFQKLWLNMGGEGSSLVVTTWSFGPLTEPDDPLLDSSCSLASWPPLNGGNAGA